LGGQAGAVVIQLKFIQMNRILRVLKRIWIFNFIRRIYNASKQYNGKYMEILKWGFRSNEYTNYTYELTQDNIVSLAHMISVITGRDYKVILSYINEAQNNQSLKEEIASSIKKSPEGKFADREISFGRRLGWYALIRVIKPKVVVETGVDKGMGSVLLCSALIRNQEEGFEGKYFGTDINPAAGYLLTDKYKGTGKILYGDSIKTLSQFKEQIDVFINDSDHSADYEYREYLTIQHLINDHTILLGDNSHCTDKLMSFSEETNRSFLFFKEIPKNHWHAGGGIGFSFKKIQTNTGSKDTVPSRETALSGVHRGGMNN
jgi:hypothetical protein